MVVPIQANLLYVVDRRPSSFCAPSDPGGQDFLPIQAPFLYVVDCRPSFSFCATLEDRARPNLRFPFICSDARYRIYLLCCLPPRMYIRFHLSPSCKVYYPICLSGPHRAKRSPTTPLPPPTLFSYPSPTLPLTVKKTAKRTALLPLRKRYEDFWVMAAAENHVIFSDP